MKGRLLSRPEDLPARADVVVIGAGIMGLVTAWHLARLRPELRVVVVERGYLCSGASGRNGGGVRAQWASATNVALMRESLARFERFATEMKINIWFRRGGYLFLARSEERARELAGSVEVQRAHGLRTRLVDGAEAARIVPGIAVADLVVGSFNPDDGVLFPWPMVMGYARAAVDAGVGIFPFTQVDAFESDGTRVRAVVTSRGRVETERVVVAAGAWSPELLRMIDVELPSHPHRHEICASEPLKPFLGPLVAELASGLYFSQSMRGEIVGGIGDALAPDEARHDSSLRFLGRYAKGLTRAMPRLGGVRVMRQWAGLYDITPDGNPLVGPIDELAGVWLTSGFMGHGFMMAPIIGELSAQLMVGEASAETRAIFDRWNLRRYRTGELLSESMILG